MTIGIAWMSLHSCHLTLSNVLRKGQQKDRGNFKVSVSKKSQANVKWRKMAHLKLHVNLNLHIALYFSRSSYLQIAVPNTRFFYKQHFISNARLKLAKKNMRKLSNTLGLNFWQACPKNKFFCVNKIIWLIVMKMNMIMKKQIA